MADTIIEPYLFFGGRCEEALEFYGKTIDAKVDFMMRYKESPQAPSPGMLPAGYENKIMHTTFRIGKSVLMGSDGCGEALEFKGFSLSLAAADEAEAKRAFNALSEGGKVKMPLTKTFWSPCFGMLTDRFGMEWMISVPAPR